MNLFSKFQSSVVWAILLVVQCETVFAQSDAARSAYERAAAVQAAEDNHWLLNQRVFAKWIGVTDHFWYERKTTSGSEYRLVNADSGENKILVERQALATALTEALQTEIKVPDLVVGTLRVEDSLDEITFTAYGKEWHYTLADGVLEEMPARAQADRSLAVSPDDKRAVFLREHNLWLRDLESGEETQLTTDGTEFFAYAAAPVSGRAFVTRPEVIWSPDSTRLLTVQTDDRLVEDLAIIDFAPADGSVRPQVINTRTALPGDEHVTTFRITSINVESGRQVGARYLHIPAVRMNDTPISGNRAWWDDDSRTAYFVDIERGEKAAHVVEFNTATGESSVVFSETTEAGYLELGTNVYMPTALVPIPERDQLVWFSERSGWAHLYLYDLQTGDLIRQLSKGDWRIGDTLRLVNERDELFVSISGRRAEVDPYYREIARIDLDSGRIKILSASDADHLVTSPGDFGVGVEAFLTGISVDENLGVSPTGNYYLETIQRVDRPSRNVLRDRNGKEVAVIEEADTSTLPEGFTWPEPVLLTAADGKTTISAAMFRPSNFDPEKRYAIIDHIYGGPQVSNVPESVLDMAAYAAQSVAELGFIVVVLDGRGTSDRSRAFHEASYGAAHTASNLEDHIAGIRQLAERYSYIDVDRVGIFGFSGGGYMTANAMLRFPDFFDVGVAGAGNHDQRLFWHSWGERYQGMLDGDNYLPQANLTYAKNLKGKLLFIHGLKDYGVHPGGLFQLTQALMDANKDFDMVLLPQKGHELPGYALKRQWDYFVRHLDGREPPIDFVVMSSTDLAQVRLAQRMASLSGAALKGEASVEEQTAGATGEQIEDE